MISPLFYSYFNAFSFASGFIQPRISTISPAISWIAFGKIAENPVITPNSTVQVVVPSAANRYLESVTVSAVANTTTA